MNSDLARGFSPAKRLTVGILIFDDVEVLDFAGPFEVFSRTRTVAGADSRRTDDSAPFETFTVARTRDAVTAIGGLTGAAALRAGPTRRRSTSSSSPAASARARCCTTRRRWRGFARPPARAAPGDVGLHRRAAAREGRAARGTPRDDALGGARTAGDDRSDDSACSASAASSTTASSRRPACPPASTCRSPSSNRSAAAPSPLETAHYIEYPWGRDDVPKHQDAL